MLSRNVPRVLRGTKGCLSELTSVCGDHFEQGVLELEPQFLPPSLNVNGHVKLTEKTPQEDQQMWFDIQTWFPLLSIGLSAAICCTIASYFIEQATRSKPSI